MTLKAHREAILELDPVQQPPAVLDAFARHVDRLGHVADEQGRASCTVEATAMHHAAIARLRSEIGVAGVAVLLEKAFALNEALGARRIGTRAGR